MTQELRSRHDAKHTLAPSTAPSTDSKTLSNVSMLSEAKSELRNLPHIIAPEIGSALPIDSELSQPAVVCN